MLGNGELRADLTLAFVALLFAGLHRHRAWTKSARACFLAFLVLGSAGFGARSALEIRENLREPPAWDFLGFWLHARAAAAGRNFYDPGSAREAAAQLVVSEEFEREIIETGFWYPPPSMFLFLPLGWLDPHPALALWYALHLALFALDAWLLWRVFFRRGSAVELGACVALSCVCGGTLLTFGHAQTTFAGLLALLLFWTRRDRFAGGAWALAATLVKPLLAVLALGLLCARRWRALTGLLAWTAAAALGSIVVFGGSVFRDSLTRNHVEAKPAWIFSETSNQSVLGCVLRVTGADCAGADCITNPVFLGIAALLAATTLPLACALARTREDWTIALLLLLALLVYPVSQHFYSVFLIPPLLVVWRDREQVPAGAATAGLLAAAVLTLCAFDDGRVTLAGTLLLWGSMSLFATRLLLAQRNGR